MTATLTVPARDLLTHDSTHDVLTVHSRPGVPTVVGLDWERDGWRVSFAGQPSRHVSRDELLTETFDGVDYVVVEQAHMRERTVYSVAQVYTQDELAKLPFRHKIRLFPSMPGQLARAARAVGNVDATRTNDYGAAMPDKQRDSETLAAYALMYPEKLRSWKPFRLPCEDRSRALWEARGALRDDLREALNPLRTAWNSMGTAEKYALPEVARLCDLLDANFDRLPEGVKEQFGIKRSKRAGIRVERMSAALTVYLCVYDREGNLRRRPDGGPLGTRFIRGAIGLSSSYYPNMARSQLTYHGMRHYKGGRDGGCRSEYMRNLRHFLRFLREADSFTLDSTHDVLTVHSEQ